MNNPTLLAQADQAFATGRPNQGLELLREYNSANASDAASWHRQAIVEEQIGDFSIAGKAHFNCIDMAPNNAMAYLYGGYWLQQKQQIADASALYSLAEELNASTLMLWQQNNVSDETKHRSREANTVMRGFLSDQHRSVCSQQGNAERVARAQWVKTSDKAIDFGLENFSPELFFIPDLTRKPFYPAEELAWSETLHSNCQVIKNELRYALQERLIEDSFRPYLDEKFKRHSGLGELANSKNWLAIDLYKNGLLNSEISPLFQETLKALDTLPTYNLGENPFEVFFSFLKPHQSIAPHFGQSNHSLTVHLPLDIPPNCHLELGAQKQHWQQGKVLAFDDSFLHSAHNNSDKTRVVLIFSIWHPDLSSNERDAIQLSFKARHQWVLERRSSIQRLREG